MEDDTWSFGLSTSSRSFQSRLKSIADICIDFEDGDSDDELKEAYPCPFCSEDFDMVGLCCHIDEEHPVEADSGVCPFCAERVGMNMVGHLTTQHGNLFKSQQKLRHRKFESYSTPCLSRKEQVPAGSSPIVSDSKMVMDSLLSFLHNAPAAAEPESIQCDSSAEVSLQAASSDKIVPERNIQSSSLSDKEQIEKAQRSDFVQELLMCIIFDVDDNV
ncbi:Protein DEHYDRATION-INDUCED 19 like [Quillaja saponaria]|uniref:Protein DEHYDRATION-INDUCED 19 like n=1 Tax=Quillaja saponaria TaxID=32244 RepID=A0AAD7VJA3_QUISA|nr:Protein DEHYDRATION-INDUCED 19 like [Quillaja saponaria]